MPKFQRVRFDFYYPFNMSELGKSCRFCQGGRQDPQAQELEKLLPRFQATFAYFSGKQVVNDLIPAKVHQK